MQIKQKPANKTKTSEQQQQRQQFFAHKKLLRGGTCVWCFCYRKKNINWLEIVLLASFTVLHL